MCIDENATIVDLLKLLNQNAQGICFVTNKSHSFVGVITDGDIRRSLLSGYDLKSSIVDIVNRKAFSLPVETSGAEIQKSFTDKIKHIPLLDKNNSPVDYACAHRLHRIPVMEPFLGGNELAYVTECVQTGWISSKGQFVTKFEEMVGAVCDTPNCIAVSNGTVALHLALVALGIGLGDEVIVPDFTFAASINSILYTGATPVIVDIELDTWTINPKEIRKAITKKTKAIMPVHIYGHPCDMDAIMSIAEEHNLLVVEDCAESIGSAYKGRALGSFGDAATFSFFGNKVVTTGEGGAVIFKNADHYTQGKILRDHGMSPNKRYWHDVLGFNYRMTNLQAAIGVAQMEQFQTFLGKRKLMAKTYNEAFKNLNEITPQPLQPWATSCHWLYTVLLDEKSKMDRDLLIEKLLMNGIETRPTFYPLHEMPLYKPYAEGRTFEACLKVSRRGISLPSSVTIAINEIENIASRIKNIIEMNKIQ